MKESEKIDKYFDLARKQKKLWKMNVTVVSIVVGALGTGHKGLVKKTVGTEDQRKNRYYQGKKHC